MKELFKNIQTLLIVVLVIVILLMRSCSGNVKPSEPQVIRDTIVEYVTIEKEVPVYVPKIKYVTKIDIDTITMPIDTAAILADYYAIKTYEDKQVLDSLDITITDTISQNQIMGRYLKYNFTYPRTTIKEKIYLNQREFYWGLGLSGRTNQINYLGGELLYRNKNKQAYGFGIGINQDFQPVISGRMYWKIGK